ncbi:hypothetical protein [Streptomyces sp. NPDC059783]|uniref:hypothetical protein n=1 Tax=Streptomyces sp. NPDC059783 TaxID=3346944 RepID=UPI00366647F5
MSTENPEAPVIVYEPAMYYSVTVTCTTLGCSHNGNTYPIPMVYSNNGDPRYVRVIDSECNRDMVILTATKLDPQPVEE